MRRWLGLGKATTTTSSEPAATPDVDDGEVAVARNVYQKRLEQFEREQEGPVEDPRYTEEVERDLREDELFEPPGAEVSEEEIRESEELRESFQNSEMARFLLRCEELQAEELAREKLANAAPTRAEDAELWKKLPLVPGPYGSAPIPRKALTTDEEVQGRFWDFFKQFQFGLWGYRQRPYPPERPIDVQQVLGYKWLDKRYADFTMRAGGWYYKDRLGRTRGPMELVNLKTAWAAGIVDKNTFIWGDDMDEWAPIGMVYGLQSCVETPDIKLATMGSALVHKLARGLPPWTPLKGHSIKSYKQIQSEAIEKREREKAVMRQNHGIWPGESTPAHAMFLWAGGSELTDLLEQGKQEVQANKFISYEARKELAKQIPGLRPWEVNEVEQVMDLVTYCKEWYREDLGEFTTRADYERDWFESFQEKWDEITEDIETVFGRGEEADKAT
ncbi:hypothetical protein M758_6G072200 [Ceratodon purpureus]|uniref:GYF domain-containing protein n=1 Tax=Ceratodon purpureus TaxID=3225 RepID=A0A8T0HG16_CERPU|nr:hypothetical protein KC19_6G076700 [Ceratodon purpureus]KAG0613044.1 hypothetical protein M758_6G072200 [Ceratodon purpureus]